MMRILGIDPGTRATGWGLIETSSPQHLDLIQFGVIRLSSKDDIATRLYQIESGLIEIIEQSQPNVIAIEDTFYRKDPRAAMKIGQARGIALSCAARFNIQTYQYPPATIKKSVTGHGNATKDFVKRMITTLLKIEDTPPTDASDALATAICHAIKCTR